MIRNVTVKCPNCETELNVSFFDVYMLDETIKKQLEEDRLFTFVCSKCQKSIRINYDCLCVDKAHNYALALCYNADNKTKKNLISTFNYLDDDCRKRIVENRDSLLEKVYIFDDGLNDYVIEVMKALHKLSLVKEFGAEKKTEIYYSSDNNGQFVVKMDKEIYQIPFETDLYEQIRESFENEDEQEFKEVDYSWALKILSEGL